MSDQKERIQLNLRLDGHRELYDAVKARAAETNTSVNQFGINALRASLGWEPIESASGLRPDQPTPKTEVLEERLAALEERLALVVNLEERLAALEEQRGKSRKTAA